MLLPKCRRDYSVYGVGQKDGGQSGGHINTAFTSDQDVNIKVGEDIKSDHLPHLIETQTSRTSDETIRSTLSESESGISAGPGPAKNQNSPILSQRQTDADDVKLFWLTKLGYGMGVFYYDLSSTLWFSYTLLLFQVRFGSQISGALMLFGSLVSAVFTPLIGFAADYNRDSWWGARKHWYLIGTVSLTLSTPFIYSECLGCETASIGSQCGYFSVFIVLLMFGTAACQVSHVSLITDLTQDAAERVSLNAYRQCASILSSVSVYLLMYCMLDMDESHAGFGKHDLDTITVSS